MHRSWHIAAAALLIGSAHAQEPEPRGFFTTEQAARCAAVHAFALDALATAQQVPRSFRNAMRDGLVIWEYELSAAEPGMTTDDLQAAANRAVAYVRADLPMGDGPDGAQARGTFLQQEAAACEQLVETAYEGAEHPVIPHLRQAEVTVGDPTLPPPAPIPVVDAAPAQAAGDDKPKKRQLR